MVGTSNFLQFNPYNLNSEDDATYNDDSTRNNGIIVGEAPPALYNKFFYQLSTGVAALMQLAANRGQTISDVNLEALISALDSAFPYSTQSNWTQDDSAQPDYIKNKPDLDPDIISLGNKSINFTLTANREHEVNVTDSCEMVKPTIAASSKRTWCYIELTLVSGKSLAINNVKWDWDFIQALSTTNINCIMLRYKTSEGFWRGSYKKGGS